jgi:hypothetical protein
MLLLQVFLQLDPEARKKLEGTAKELGALKAAVAAAGEDATLDQACGGQLKNSVLELYTKNATIKVQMISPLSVCLRSPDASGIALQMQTLIYWTYLMAQTIQEEPKALQMSGELGEPICRRLCAYSSSKSDSEEKNHATCVG